MGKEGGWGSEREAFFVLLSSSIGTLEDPLEILGQKFNLGRMKHGALFWISSSITSFLLLWFTKICGAIVGLQTL